MSPSKRARVEAQGENWFGHFLMGQPSQSANNLTKVKISGQLLNISTDPLNMKELRVVTDTLRNKKSMALTAFRPYTGKTNCITRTY